MPVLFFFTVLSTLPLRLIRRNRMRFLIGIVLAPLFAAALCADDWPQWMGPNRDNVWRETGILDKFPPGGPQVDRPVSSPFSLSTSASD